MKKTKKEKEKKEAVKIVANWIFPIIVENEKINMIIDNTISKRRIVNCLDVEKILMLCFENFGIFRSMKRIVFMCLGVYANKLQTIFSAEESTQKKLQKIKEKGQKLSDAEFFNCINIIGMKISERKEVEERIVKNLTMLGFIEDKYISDYKSVLSLFNPRDNTPRGL